MDWTAFITGLGGATSSVIRAVDSSAPPSVIPGTTAVYNPATGQIVNTAGIGGLGGISITTILLIVGAIFLFRKL